jgi:hypothetical protein
MRPIRYLAAAALCAAGCATVGDPPRGATAENAAASSRVPADGTFRVVSVDLDQVGVGGATLVFELEAKNADAAPAKLRRIDAALTSGGRRLERGAAEPALALPARGAARTAYRLRVDFADLLSRDRTLRPGAVLTCVAALEAEIVGAGGAVRRAAANVSVELPMPATPRLAFREIVVRRSDAARVEGLLRVDLTNPNAFPFDGDRFTYAIGVAGREIATGSVEGRPSLLPNEAATLELPFAFDVRTAPEAAQALRGASAPCSLNGTLQALSPYGVLLFPVGDAGQTAVRPPSP